MNMGLNKFEVNREKGNIPLSALFTDQRNSNQTMYQSKAEKQVAFIELCKQTNGKDLSPSMLIRKVVQNALLVEFGENILKNQEMINTISNAINSELVLQEEVLDFARRHFKEMRIDSSLIN